MTRRRPDPDLSRARVPAGYARALVARFGSDPARRKALLDGAEALSGAIDGAGVETPALALMVLAENLTRLQGEAWPFDVAAVWASAMQGSLDVAVRTAPDFAAALDVLAMHGFVRAPWLVVRLKRSRGVSSLVFSPAIEISAPTWRSLATATSLATAAMLTQVAGEAFARATVRFPWPAPDYAPRLRALLPCALAFKADAFALDAPKSLLATPSPFADPGLHRSAMRDLEEAALASTMANAKDAVKRLAKRSLPRRLCEDEAAKALGCSRRSLVRRLAATGDSFRALLDEALMEEARTLLADGGRSRAEMAERLGYRDPTSFSRACRRWFKD